MINKGIRLIFLWLLNSCVWILLCNSTVPKISKDLISFSIDVSNALYSFAAGESLYKLNRFVGLVLLFGENPQAVA